MRTLLVTILALGGLTLQAAIALAGPEVPPVPATCQGFVTAQENALRSLDAEWSQSQAHLDALAALASDHAKELQSAALASDVASVVSSGKASIDTIRANAVAGIIAASRNALELCANQINGTMDSISALIELSRLKYDLDTIRANALADIADVVILAAGNLKDHAERAEALSAPAKPVTAGAPATPAADAPATADAPAITAPETPAARSPDPAESARPSAVTQRDLTKSLPPVDAAAPAGAAPAAPPDGPGDQPLNLSQPEGDNQ